MNDAKFLPKVIEYDRYQPEFYEDTKTYVRKRTSNDKVKKGLSLYNKEKKIWLRGWDSNPRMSKPIASFQD